jgi:hypothetical protein
MATRETDRQTDRLTNERRKTTNTSTLKTETNYPYTSLNVYISYPANVE